MPQARPLECPACGHERIARRPQQLQTSAGRIRIAATEWMCHLCRYTWSRPAAARPLPVWEAD